MSKLLERYKNKRLADKLGLPYTIERLWLAGCYAFNNKEAGRKVHMPYFNHHSYVNHKINDVVPVFKKKDGVAYYKILSWKKCPGSDPAVFDDEREYDLLFHHWEQQS